MIQDLDGSGVTCPIYEQGVTNRVKMTGSAKNDLDSSQAPKLDVLEKSFVSAATSIPFSNRNSLKQSSDRKPPELTVAEENCRKIQHGPRATAEIHEN